MNDIKSWSRVVQVAIAVVALTLVVAWPAAGASGRLVTRVHQQPGSPWDSNDKVVALTFDDGPSTWTPKILDVLDRYNAYATFLLIGRQATDHPRWTRRIVAEGHVAAGHTLDHKSLRGLSSSSFGHQVDDGNRAVGRITGRRVNCVRPPYGAYDSTVVQRLASRGLDTLMWSIDPKDWTRPGTLAIVSRTLGNLHPGGIVVLHDGGGDRSQTLAALPKIIRGARERGYRIVPVCR